MDPIIRAAAVSPLARQLRRPERQAMAAPAAQPLLAKQPMAAAAGTAAAAPAPAPAPAAAPPPAPASAAAAVPPELVQAAGENARLQALLHEREVEIAKLKDAAAQVQSGLTELRAEAERRGNADGEAKGERAGMEMLQAQAERLKALVVQVGQARQQVMDDAEDALVGIVFAAVCRVLGEQGASREAVQRMVHDAGAASHERGALTVRLHPDDAALLRAEGESQNDEMRISADSSITLGGCIIDSGSGSLDARFETQLELLGAALRSARAARRDIQDAI